MFWSNIVTQQPPTPAHSSGSALIAAVEPLVGRVDALITELIAHAGGEILSSIAAEHFNTGGKRLRVRLALATTKALGGDPNRAIGWAAACELFHNATLIHDDIQDGDTSRRGSPSTWARHGIPQAINVGDYLILLSFLAVDHLPVSVSLRAELTASLAAGALKVICGQAEELAATQTANCDWSGYIRTAIGKTGGLFKLPVLGAALLADRSIFEATRLATAFEALGVLFQIQDDILDLFGEKGRDAPGSDLREGKMSALVIEHLAQHPDDHSWLIPLLRQPRDQTPQAQIDATITRFRQEGALSAVCKRLHEQVTIITATPALAEEKELAALAEAMIENILAPIASLLATVDPG